MQYVRSDDGVDIAGRHICLPVHSDMRDDEIDQVLTAVSAVYGALTGV